MQTKKANVGGDGWDETGGGIADVTGGGRGDETVYYVHYTVN